MELKRMIKGSQSVLKKSSNGMMACHDINLMLSTCAEVAWQSGRDVMYRRHTSSHA